MQALPSSAQSEEGRGADAPGLLGFARAQQQPDGRAAAHAKPVAHAHRQLLNGERDAAGRDGLCAQLRHKPRVHHVVDRGDHHANDRRNAEAERQPRDGRFCHPFIWIGRISLHRSFSRSPGHKPLPSPNTGKGSGLCRFVTFQGSKNQAFACFLLICTLINRTTMPATSATIVLSTSGEMKPSATTKVTARIHSGSSVLK